MQRETSKQITSLQLLFTFLKVAVNNLVSYNKICMLCMA